MNDMRWTAQQLAAKGRFGDSMLLHVNPIEMAGIASLVPLTINPITGLPEAFLPFLLALLGGAGGAAGVGAAGAAAAGTVAAAAPALTAGLAAGAGAAGAAGLGTAAAAAPLLTAAPTALASTLGAGAITPALSAGTGLLASAAPAGGISSLLGTGAAGAAGAAPLAASLPAVTSALPVASPGIASLTGAAGTDALIGAAGADTLATLPATTTAIPALAPSTALAPGPVGAGFSAPGSTSALVATSPSSVTPALPAKAASDALVATSPSSVTPALETTTVLPAARPEIAAATAPSPAGGGMLSGLGGWIGKNPMMAMMMGQQLMSGIGGLLKKDKKKDNGNYHKGEYKGGAPEAPGPTYVAGTDAEHDWFPHYASRVYASGGGLIGYAGGGPVDPQAQMPQDMSYPINGVPGGGIADLAGGPEEIPSSPYPTEQIGSEPEPAPDQAPTPEGVANPDHDQELVMQMVEVIQGKHPDPEPVIKAFVQEFGEQALQDLAARVKQTMGGDQPPADGAPPGPPLGPRQAAMAAAGPPPSMPPMQQGGPPQQGFAIGGAVGGGGDGLSDSVPAMIDGRQPAALSRGEFVIPADAVSGLGNGSTDAGAEQLQGMVNNVRMARGGQVGQPPPLQGGIAAMFAGGRVGYKKGGKVVRITNEEGVEEDIPEEDIIESHRIIGTEPPSSRMDKIWINARRPKVIPNSPWSEEWSKEIGEWQDANRRVLERESR